MTLQGLDSRGLLSDVDRSNLKKLQDLSTVLQQMAENAQLAGRVNNDILRQVKEELSGSASSVLAILDQISKGLEDIAKVEQSARLAGRRMTLTLIPK